MKRTLCAKLFAALCLCLGLLVASATGFAYSGGGGPRDRHGDRHETSYHGHYRYHHGRYYKPVFFGLFEVIIGVPQVGAVVRVLPTGYNVAVIGGVTYYHHNNVYYRTCPSGYVVVPAPSNVVVVPATVVPAYNIYGERVVINVPNARGGYTAVTLVKLQDGYVGPQGEYYVGHPTTAQLAALYGR